MTNLTVRLGTILVAGSVLAGDMQITIHTDQPGKAISPDLILKVVNPDASSWAAHVTFAGDPAVRAEARQTVLTGDPKAFNTFAHPQTIIPKTSAYAVAKSFRWEVPPYSLNILRCRAR